MRLTGPAAGVTRGPAGHRRRRLPAAGPVGNPPDLREAAESCVVPPASKSELSPHQHHTLRTAGGDMSGATNMTCGDW